MINVNAMILHPWEACKTFSDPFYAHSKCANYCDEMYTLYPQNVLPGEYSITNNRCCCKSFTKKYKILFDKNTFIDQGRGIVSMTPEKLEAAKSTCASLCAKMSEIDKQVYPKPSYFDTTTIDVHEKSGMCVCTAKQPKIAPIRVQSESSVQSTEAPVEEEIKTSLKLLYPAAINKTININQEPDVVTDDVADDIFPEWVMIFINIFLFIVGLGILIGLFILLASLI